MKRLALMVVGSLTDWVVAFSGTDEDEEDNHLRVPGPSRVVRGIAEKEEGDVSFVVVEDCHSEDRNDLGDKGGDDNTNDDGHAAARDGGEYLSRDDAVDHSITNHDNDIKQDGEFWKASIPVLMRLDASDTSILETSERFDLVIDAAQSSGNGDWRGVSRSGSWWRWCPFSMSIRNWREMPLCWALGCHFGRL